MKVEIKDNQIIITAPIQSAVVSRTGKTFVVATSNGFIKTTAQIDGKPVSVNLNACIPVR